MNTMSEQITQETFWKKLERSLFEPHSSLKEVGTRRQARLITIVALILTFTNLMGAVASYLSTGEIVAAIVLIILSISSGIGYAFARRPKYFIGGYIIVGLLTISAFTNPSGADSISSSLYAYLIVAMVFASVSFSFRLMFVYVVVCNAAIPLLPLIYQGYTNIGFDLAVFLPFSALLLAAMRYRDNVERDRLEEMSVVNKELEDIRNTLENRVTERTQQLENQTLRLRVVADIAKDAASSKDVTELLERSAQFIHSRFNFYQTGIFLIDENREYAVLVASPTEPGKQMMANGHKLRVGEVGIVGRVAATGDPRITLDTGGDAVHFNNPFLPNTRSEMALPLKAENRTIGVLDIQSEQPQAFNEDDIAIMQVLTDQLAIAIERTRLLQQVEENLKELQQAYGQSTRESWKSLAESGLLSNSGYRFDNVSIQEINSAP